VDKLLKQRIVGAIVLISLAVIFIPMLLSGKSKLLSNQLRSNIPPKPSYEIKRPEMTQFKQLEQPSFSRPEPEVVKNLPLLDANKSLSESKKPAISPSIKVSKVPPIDVSKEKQLEQSNTKTQSRGTDPVLSPKTAQTSQQHVHLATSWIVQVGSFSQKKNATKLRDKIQKSGISTFVSEAQSNKGKVYRVRVGPELERSLADELRKKMRRKFGLDGIVIRYP